MQQSYHKQFDQLVKLFQENNNCNTWNEISLQNYSCGISDIVKFQNNFGQIQQIVSLSLKNDNILYLVQVTLYRTSSDIKKYISQKYITDCFGQTELFLTSEIIWICWNQIQEKITLHSLDSYLELGCPKNEYYSRASYDQLSKSFSPPFDKWKSQYCVCGRPDIPDISYIQCEKCQVWYHFECSKLSDEELYFAESLDFICFNCQKQ